MSQILPHTLHGYSVYSPPTAQAHVVDVEQQTISRTYGRVQLLVLGLVVSALVATVGRAMQLRSSAINPTQTPAISQVASTPKASVSVPKTVPANTVIAPQPTSEDLQALLNAWQTNHGSTYGVVIQEIGGANRRASLNEHKQFESASLYKLIVADYIYNQAMKGSLSLNATLGMNQTIGQCLKPMIVVSDNYCGESIGWAVGWPRLSSFAQAAGFSDTNLSPINVTSAADMSMYLAKLLDGSLLTNHDYQNQLIGYMKAQIYRSGVPAGVPGVPVADKVGFDPGVWNDAAIVYGPKSTYVLVVLSQNSNSTAIRELSARVGSFFSQ